MFPGDEIRLKDSLSVLIETTERALGIFEAHSQLLRDIEIKPSVKSLFQLADASLDVLDAKPYEFDVRNRF